MSMKSLIKILLLTAACLIPVSLSFSSLAAFTRCVVRSPSTPLLASSSEESGASERDDGAPSAPPGPPVVKEQRLDPLMASLTRNDEAGSSPTKTLPYFGEVSVDGGLLVLVPAAVISILGVILSIVIVFNSSDEIVGSINSVGQNLADQVTSQPNQVYDPNVCRGLCAPTQSDIGGLENLMESFRKQ